MGSYLLGYVLTAWNPIYHLFTDPAVAFRPPYEADVENLFDGEHAEGQIVTQLPGDFRQLMTSDYLQELMHPVRAAARRAAGEQYVRARKLEGPDPAVRSDGATGPWPRPTPRPAPVACVRALPM